ncbi:LPXTG cell wall anchor domain-containing protein [Enterococcus sp. AZ015]|uniref:LPXTG cell wall anchor domain-containing protein n=1 Tax=Enterococcus sp. AZ015 TaxID=2774888 RepID=UPI003D28DEF7
MLEKIKRLSIAVLMIAVFSSSVVAAKEVQRVETNGSIGFTGTYEPIGTPDPTPPGSMVRPPITEEAKPGGILPQTNDNVSSWLQSLGSLSVSFVFLLWKRKKNHIKNENYKKAGIST